MDGDSSFCDDTSSSSSTFISCKSNSCNPINKNSDIKFKCPSELTLNKDETPHNVLSTNLANNPTNFGITNYNLYYGDEQDECSSVTTVPSIQSIKSYSFGLQNNLIILDQFAIIKKLENNPEIDYFYLIYAVERSSPDYTFYALKLVDNVDVQDEYLTISLRGVLSCKPKENIFIPLDEWKNDYKHFLDLIKLRTFRLFLLQRSFHSWKSYISFKKFNHSKKLIEQSAFMNDPVFRKSLLAIREMCIEFFEKSFFDIKNTKTITLEEFDFLQRKKTKNVLQDINLFRRTTLSVVTDSCSDIFINAGYTFDDSNITIEQTVYGNLASYGFKVKIPKNVELQLSCTEQARKRELYNYLSRFIRLIDYLIINVLQTVLRNTYGRYVNIMKSYKVPSINYEKDISPSQVKSKYPQIVINLIITEKKEIDISPSDEFIQNAFKNIQLNWEEQLIDENEPILCDPQLEKFTRHYINKTIEPPLYDSAPTITNVIKDDVKIKNIKREMKNVLDKNLHFMENYKERFKNVLEFYKEIVDFDDSNILDNEDCNLFREWCSRYYQERNLVNRIEDSQSLGLFLLQLKKFKNTVLPVIRKKIELLHSVITGIAKKKANYLLMETTDSISFFQMQPVSMIDYVSYIKFIDHCQQNSITMENELDYLTNLYKIMNDYKISTKQIKYSNIIDNFKKFQSTLTSNVARRSDLVVEFDRLVQIDIKVLVEKILILKEESAEPWLLDRQSDPEKAKETLDDLTKRIQEYTDLANEYRSYQKDFKVEMTRFEILDEVTNDVKLRSLLWETLHSWDEAVDYWTNLDFEQINVEELTSQITKNFKNISQFEQKFPPNNIVPPLKSRVELMKERLPIISYLRNNNLRTRHWQKIGHMLNYDFKKQDKKLTFNVFEELGAFDHETELKEISSAASSEAGLENMLKKVENIWQKLEFIVHQHKDNKDVFILGSLEEVQTAFDDSSITIQTIAASRYVEPIRPRVEDWSKKLDLFWRTLDAWQYCQQQWLYLEAIFSAPGIQRQLPLESKLFAVVDKFWKEKMRQTAKMPLALENCTEPYLLGQFEENNTRLDQILKCLEAYLETKRIAFPRFFFLSNDELIEILAQTRNPHAVQIHLQKCFDAIHRLEFATQGMKGAEAILSTDIVAMLSPEGERVPLGKGLKARGNVEDWLGHVESSMFSSLKKEMKLAISDFNERGREAFLWSHPSQIILTVSQIFWAKDVHQILDSDKPIDKMKNFETKSYSDLNILAGMVRGELPNLIRSVIINLITLDVHARDIITSIVEKQVASSNDFEWTKVLRYYWDPIEDKCIANMSNSEYPYGYEYLGAQRRLVITPLTDKCYLCLLGALQLDLGGAPAGPAGTGKTETTKDLAKALAIQCVVFNCSEGLDYRMMGRFFSGLATSGAWCCFDEFNRIDIEVLSVIAQQLITIKNAKVARVKQFMFEGRMIKLVRSCAAFITMNPGYAGRTELPDNLKYLFRPFAMMVPDYKLISEVTLYAEGFESSKPLSKKMTLLYTLCSEQLSQQDHYDFGMRAVKSVLVMAGSLKRENPDKPEDVVLIRALRDSNLPKFLADDAELFHGILGDLFPGIVIPNEDYGQFYSTAIKILKDGGLQPEECSLNKVIQLHETMRVRHGVMLVGPTGSGKSTVLRTLCHTYTLLHKLRVKGAFYQTVHMYTVNPKAVTIGELYGEVNTLTNEWKDGLIGSIVRHACSFTTEDHQWIVCDGPVDAVWIENMNTVLDDNKMLCLANSERIKFTPYVHMLFEVMDLSQASPATVSRCGMVYVDPSELKWMPYVKSWLQKLKAAGILNDEIHHKLIALFESYVKEGLAFFNKNCGQTIAQVDIGKVCTICVLLESMLKEFRNTNNNASSHQINTFLFNAFIFSYMWAIGGNGNENSWTTFESFVKEQLMKKKESTIPMNEDLWNLYVNISTGELEPWSKIMPDFNYNKEMPFFDITVPTIDTVRFGYIFTRFLSVDKPILFTGSTGVGKSIIAKLVLNEFEKSGNWVPVIMNFSAQTSSSKTQEILELKLERKKKTLLGAPIGKKICVFVDDINMPKLDTYGSQPPIELLRQVIDHKGLYDKEKLFWKGIEDTTLTCACAPPGGGRNPLTPRFTRLFGVLSIPMPSENSLLKIFSNIMNGFLSDFAQSIIDVGDKIVSSTIEVYLRIAKDLLPTPEKSHYVFNLRDLSKCIQGILQADSSVFVTANQMIKLFYHECLRVFQDRLINNEDKSYFDRLLSEICYRNFGDGALPHPNKKSINQPAVLLFGDFMGGVAMQQRIYEEITDIAKARNVLQDYLDDYCFTTSKEMNIIFFMDAIEHLCKLARILRFERGNGLLVGVGGMGKQSLTKLASHVNNYRCVQIEVSQNYDLNNWHEDLRKFYFEPGAYAKHTTFLFTDTQIVTEEFLEDINNTLNSGEVPNLFDAEELEKAIIATRPAAKEAGIDETNRDAIYQFFIRRIRNYLHLMLCMSPVGSAFRYRCRMFPSLVNCCTIDWFFTWPKEALLSVAVKAISPVTNNEKETTTFASICVLIHESVEHMTVKFYNEMRRRYYTTPSSYLELLKLFLTTLERKSNDVKMLKIKISNGLSKLHDTNDVIADMKQQLVILAPKLKLSKEEVSKLMKTLTKQQAEVEKVKSVVAADEAVAKKKAAETGTLEADARKDLEVALPALEAAQKALSSLNKNDINEIKVFNQPPQLVRFVMEAVNLLLGEKTNWKTAKSVLADIRFLDRLINFPKDDINDKLLNKLQEYVNHPDFVPEKVEKQSKVCKSICIWVRAISGYAKIFRVVQPKRLKLQKAQEELKAINDVLEEKQKQLANIERESQALQNQYDKAVKNLSKLENSIVLGEGRINRAGRLTSALENEEIRWKESVKRFDEQIENLIGDCMVAAGGLAYLGAFTNTYREELIENWLSQCNKEKIKTTKNFNLISVLANPYEIRVWNTHGLPRDKVSTENAIMVTQAGKWPLMIDPQEQANRWIKSMEQENSLKVCKMTDPNFMRYIEACIRSGTPLLLQEVGETLDPSIETVLLKQTFVQGGRTMIRIGDSDVEYDSNFKLYITTKLANPHYLPEVCIKVTVINFTVTPDGLEEQLLGDVVNLERPDLESMRNELIAKINADKNELQIIEDKILALLFSSGDDILDNEELVEILNNSKETSEVIAARLEETEKTEKMISTTRKKYSVISNRGSVLYFVVANLANIDPMYQYSLKYFTQIFNQVIERCEKHDNLDKHLEVLLQLITVSIYQNISRGLFERHKIIFSFMLNIAIYLDAEIISYSQWNYLLRGSEQIKNLPKKPNYNVLTELTWEAINYLVLNFPKFENFLPDALKKIKITIGEYEEEINLIAQNNKPAALFWNNLLDDMDKLMLIKTLKEEKLIFGITAYVKKNFGQQLVESPMISLQYIFPETSKITPLIYILSTGSDPFSAFQKFVNERNFSNKMKAISLGQGQGPIAEKLISKGKTEGHWIFLQNCHLASSWMPSMENLVVNISEDSKKVHDDFRLFLSSMPSATFPVSVLQNSVKVTNEPSKGLKANIKRSLFEIEESFFENHPQEDKWRKMLFGICFFHAIIQERKKFGPLGWNIVYEFNDNDRECCMSNINIFCSKKDIPWDALIYITGEITYGGRITDNWDQRCLKTILSNYLSPKTLSPNYKYSPSGIYYCPQYTKLQEYKDFVEQFPMNENPEVFGMHENANIAYQLRETRTVVMTIMEVQPKISKEGSTKSSSDIVYELAIMIKNRISKKIDLDKCHPVHLKKDDHNRVPSLTTVLIHEVERYNKLLVKFHVSMEDLMKAIKGFVVMSDDLEKVFSALYNNQVPQMWHNVNVYPSLKSLGSWIKDLELRIHFIETWLTVAAPISFWISGLSFPQGFITGVLQTHARKYNIPIDELKLDFAYSKTVLDQEEIKSLYEKNKSKVSDIYKKLESPVDGVLIHGLFLDAARWDFKTMTLADENKGEMNPTLPVLQIMPVLTLLENDPRYVCPLYKTSIRAGVLSTTGHSTNFVISILIPSKKEQSYWIHRGTALLIQITN